MTNTAISTIVDAEGLWQVNGAGLWTVVPDPLRPVSALACAIGLLDWALWQLDPQSGLIASIRRSDELRPVGIQRPDGYVELSPGHPQRRKVLAHRLVWSRLNGPIPAGHQINHIDGVKNHNAPANLEAVTGLQNMRHAADQQLPRARRLTAAQAGEIRRLHRETRSYKAIMAQTGATIRQVRSVAQGVTFQHID